MTLESGGVYFYIQVNHSHQSHTLSHQETSPDLGMSLRPSLTVSLVFCPFAYSQILYSFEEGAHLFHRSGLCLVFGVGNGVSVGTLVSAPTGR